MQTKLGRNMVIKSINSVILNKEKKSHKALPLLVYPLNYFLKKRIIRNNISEIMCNTFVNIFFVIFILIF